MNEHDKENHRLQHLYESTLLVGQCAETPNQLFVCFLAQDEPKMHRALDEFEVRHGYRPQTVTVDANGAFTGFWLKKAEAATEDPVLAPLAPLIPLEEAQFLESRASRGLVTLIQAPTINAMNDHLFAALKRAVVATHLPYLN